MRNLHLPSLSQQPAVLSFQAEADRIQPPHEHTQFGTLLRHLLTRFLHHELLASEDETKRVLQIAYAAALPTLIVSLFLFVPYHAMPPLPHPRPFWSQVGDHYIFTMYSFVLMGIATVYEWDLLFPDFLDVYVLNVLPIAPRRLFSARVLAVLIFLTIVLLGTSLLGTVAFPLVADSPTPWHDLFAHATAVATSGAFAATTLLALQGILLNILGEPLFRRIGPLLQGASLMLLLAILLLTPAFLHDPQALLTATTPGVAWFPPFWFLGLYERLLHGPAALALFHRLALRALLALTLSTAAVFLTYPLAYRHRVRQIIEGTVATKREPSFRWLHPVLHNTVLRTPAHRAVVHLANQTVFRTQGHRVLLGLYAGLTVALVLAQLLVLRITAGRIHPAILPQGIRAAVPIAVFLTTLALRAASWTPIDRRGAWIFRSILGRAQRPHLLGTRHWMTLWSTLAGIATALALYPLAPASFHHPRILTGQLLVSLGLSVLLADLYLHRRESLPFTDLRITSVADLPLAILRNFVLFPVLVVILLAFEPRFESSWPHLLKLALAFTLAHLALTRLHARSLTHLTADALVPDEDVFPQGLGLRDG